MPTFGSSMPQVAVKCAKTGAGKFSFPNPVAKTKAFLAALWKEHQVWFPQQVYLLRSELEQFQNKIRQRFAQAMIAVSALMPLPEWLLNRISKDYFFSPRKVMGLKFDKKLDLNKHIRVQSFQLEPNSDNLETLHSFHLPAPEGKPTIVFFHGRDTNIGHLGRVFKAAQGKYGVFAYDYPGFGKSDGIPTEEGLKKSGLSACRYLARPHSEGGLGIPMNDQILMGYSLGGGVASHVAGELGKLPKEEWPRRLVLVNTFTDLRSSFEAKLKEQNNWLGRIVASLYNPKRITLEFNSKKALENVPFPIKVFHCRKDNVIPYSQGEELAQVGKVRQPITEIEIGKSHNIREAEVKEILGKLEKEDAPNIGVKPATQSTFGWPFGLSRKPA